MISLIIPTYYNSPEIPFLLSQCLLSLKGLTEEDEIFIEIDTKGEGFAKTVNQGLKRATKEYIAILNNDIKMTEGSLKDFCLPNALVRPTLVYGDLAKFAFVVMSRQVFEKVGFLDEQFEVGYFEDDDYLKRCELAGVELITLPTKVWHKGGATISRMNTDALMQLNGNRFKQKWNTK